MRKYLWALALCGAAGMAVPSWAQERSKSLFGLGRSPKPAAAPSEKAPKTAKLKNYGEIFGDEEPKPNAPSADAPSPAAVQKMITEAEQSKSASEEANPFERKDLFVEKAPVDQKSNPVAKAPVTDKSALLDEFDRLDELDELEEEQDTVAAKATPKKALAPAKSAAPEIRPAATPSTSAEGRVIVRTPAKSAPPMKTAAVEKAAATPQKTSAEKPAWASAESDVVAADFDTAPQKKVAPSIKQIRAEEGTSARPTATATRTPVAKAPTKKAPAAQPSVAKTPASRLNTPINVVSASDEFSATESLPADLDEPTVAAPASPAPVVSKSRLTVSRNSGPLADSPVVPGSKSTALDSTYSAPTVAKPAASVAQSPTVTVEWRSTGAVNVGQESSCELVVKNSGSVSAQKVEIAANFPAHVRLVSADPKPESSSDLVWEFDEIAPGDQKIIHVNFIPVERGEVAAAASVRFTGAASTSFAVTEPLLSVKLEGASEVMVGESAPQTLIVSNPGTGTAANVKIEAIIPAGLEHARGERLSMELGNLAPGENRPIRLALTAVAGGRQVIECHASADNGLVQSASAEVTVIAPSLEASISGPSLRYLGRQATYTLHVANDGAAATDNVRVMHKIPEGFEFVSAERGAQYDPQNRMLNWFVGRLDRGEESQVAVVLNSKSAGEFTHFVRATSEHGAISDAEVTTRVEGAASLVVDVIDLDDPVEVGVETAYEVRVKNEGTAPAQNVGLTCELPAGVEFMTASGDSSHANEKELVVFQPVAEVAAGKTLTYRVKVKGTLSGNMRFRTKVSSDSLAEPLASEEMTKIYGE